MGDKKFANGAEFVAAVVTIIAAEMGGVSDQVCPDGYHRDAMEKPPRGFGEEHGEAVLGCCEEIAPFGGEDLAAGENERTTFVIIERVGPAPGNGRDAGHRHAVISGPHQRPRPDERDQKAARRGGGRRGGQRRSTIIFLISAIALAGFKFFGQVRVQFMMVWQR